MSQRGISPEFMAGARDGFERFLPVSVGLIPWAIVTGVAMRTAGFSLIEAMGMNLIVFAGTAQLGTLPLIAGGAPVWLIVLTALVLNLRFVIFSAALAPAFQGQSWGRRLLAGHLLTDGVFAVCAPRMLEAGHPSWRYGYYLAPSLFTWGLWQIFTLAGGLGAAAIPPQWSIQFMATVALLVLLVPMARERPMLVAALVAGVAALLLRDLPLRLGLIVAILAGIAAGFVAERGSLREGEAPHG